MKVSHYTLYSKSRISFLSTICVNGYFLFWVNVDFDINIFQTAFQNTHYPVEAIGVENNRISTPSSSVSPDVLVVSGVDVSLNLSGVVL